MQFFTAVMHKNQGSAYGLSFLELPGCFASADNWAEVPAKANEAISLWMENRDPIEVTLDERALAREDADMEMKDGGVLILIPYLPNVFGAGSHI
ncbi:type II toxin-antitoxin system HicB family antitoxin [Falsirhodobacter sp. 1013]|uniref:type II toxin-antitoxin system HicB family antitoxin n=1 Tax=Falsirhodobacter sp. 1013 TaxID=3417566 RepID=UPI003EB82498